MIKQYLYALLFVCLTPSTAFAVLEEKASPSLADHLHLKHSKDPIDGGWLPNLTGLPNKDEIPLTPQAIAIIKNTKDARCKAIDLRLRMMVFQHFINYQQMVNAQNIYFNDDIAKQWAHVLAMILKESSGDTTSITDMSGRSISTYKPQTTLQRWKSMLGLTDKGPIKLNYQTNYGLTQTSADRLLDAFRLAQDQRYDTSFLEGLEGAETPRQLELNTAIAIRRLIWFYQDFAQGRVSESDKRIHQKDISKPEFSDRYQNGIDTALMYCGTRFMFSEGYPKEPKNTAELQNAMASIAYCKLGNHKTGYGVNEVDEKCFAAWVTLCPALNIDIATLTPLSYFATRNESPVCEDTFKQLLHKKPDSSLPLKDKMAHFFKAYFY